MIKVSEIYPYHKGSSFDMVYYSNVHAVLIQQKLGAALKGVSVEQGISGMDPGSKPPYAAMGHFLFDSLEVFQSSFGPHAKAIMGDIPNYTDIEPDVLISEVKISR